MSLNLEYSAASWFKPFLRTEGLASSDVGTGYQNRTYHTSAQLGMRFTPLSNLELEPGLGLISERFLSALSGPSTAHDNSGKSQFLTARITPTSSFPFEGRFSETQQTQGLLFTHEVSGTGSASRVLFGHQSLRADLEGFRGKYTYPLGASDEEKHQRLSRLRLSYELLNLTRIQGRLSETHSEEAYDYSSPDSALSSPSKNYGKKEDLLLGSLAYHPFQSLDLGCEMKRAKSENDYPNQPINTQFLDSKSLVVRAQARPNASSVLDFVQTFGLDSYDFPHPFNFNQRDLGTSSTFFRSWLQATATTRLGLAIQVRQDHLVYLRSEMSANNRWTRTYTAAPQLSLNPLPWLLWTQCYILRADYNLYDFVSANNLLLRSATVQDTLRFGPPGVNYLLVTFGGQVQSQGPYLYDQVKKSYGYYTSQESPRYNFGFMVSRGFRQGTLVVTPGYYYEQRKIVDFLPDTSFTKLLPSVSNRVIEQDFSLNAEARATSRTTFSLQATRSVRKGEQSFWDIRAVLDWRI